MKKTYKSPELKVLVLQSDEMMYASQEEVLDINVNFDALWQDSFS